MIDYKEYVEKINAIRSREMMTFMELTKAIGVSFSTLKRVMGVEPKPVCLKTLKKIKKFIEKYEGK